MKRIVLMLLFFTNLFGSVVNVENIYPSDNVCVLSKSPLTDKLIICVNGKMYESITDTIFKELKYLNNKSMKCNCVDR